ncbi:MAG: tetraacyldisaccharide 4'-kinase [Terriglobales bacterium]
MLDRLFGASVRLRNALYDSGRFHSRHLEGPVVSVGNISVGGAGKTPFVIALGELLKSSGIAFDVLSRGYRRTSKGVLQVDPAGTPADFGDEPLLIAQRLNAPVIVGESRYAAGQWSEGKYGARLHLLDDGFQHRRLARDFDIVLITAADLDDRLLPAGRLREPLASIRRADAVVIAEDVNPTHLPLHGDQALWRLHRGIEILGGPPWPVLPGWGTTQSTIDNRKSEVPLHAFCAIARPERFFEDLKKHGCSLADTVIFPDHHRYTDSDVKQILSSAAKSNGVGFVTTEKDLINVGPLAAQLQPLHVARVTIELLDSRHAIERMLQTLVHRGKTA